jgi:pimeloyl-ACP methyl ester carboxylesterase
MSAAEIIGAWEAAGHLVRVGDDEVFVVDAAPDGPVAAPPLLVLHGFPTSSIDYHEVMPALRAGRRVVLLDYPGFGQSSKVDRTYSLFGQADVVEAVARELDLGEIDLLTHDVGDSIGGELLARDLDDGLPFTIRRRVVTNGSIYLDLAHLTDGQKFLLALPDEQLAPESAADVDTLTAALVATMAPDTKADPEVVRAAADLIMVSGGNRLLPRIIRYIEERRVHEARWTGAIERHQAPLTIVWGDLDPIADWVMTDRLLERRPDARRVRLDGIGHYPMVEAPARFADAVVAAL